MPRTPPQASTHRPSPLDEFISWCYPIATELDTQAFTRATARKISALQTETERAAAAWHAERAAALCASSRGAAGIGKARVGLNGAVKTADDAFVRHLRRVLPAWPGDQLPFQIRWCEELARQGMTFGRLYFQVEALDDGYALTVREDLRQTLLSRREQEVAALIAAGHTLKQAAEELAITISTVSTHLYRVYEKLGISKRSELTAWVQAHGEPGRRRARG